MKVIRSNLIMITLVLAIALAVMSAAGFIAGCGSSAGDNGGSAAPADNSGAPAKQASASGAGACQLVTNADMDQAVGQPFQEGTQKESAGSGSGTVCTFESVAQNSLGLAQMTVLVMYYPGGAPASDPTRQQTVSGIGDDAYYSDTGINVVKGHDWLVISYLKTNETGPDPRLEGLARAAAARM